MSMRRAHDRAPQFTGNRLVLDELPLALQELQVLDAEDRLADHCISSRRRSRFSKMARSVTTKRSALPSWRAQVQCGMVNTSCFDHSNVFSPTVDLPCPETTRH